MLTLVIVVGVSRDLIHEGGGGSPVLVGKDFVDTSLELAFRLGLIVAEEEKDGELMMSVMSVSTPSTQRSEQVRVHRHGISGRIVNT